MKKCHEVDALYRAHLFLLILRAITEAFQLSKLKTEKKLVENATLLFEPLQRVHKKIASFSPILCCKNQKQARKLLVNRRILSGENESISKRQCKSTQNASISDSAIGQHLLDKKNFREIFDINWFLILPKEQSFFHLNTLEAIFIEFLEPSFCHQKEFVYGLRLSRLRCK